MRMLAGNGPLLVERSDGSLHLVETALEESVRTEWILLTRCSARGDQHDQHRRPRRCCLARLTKLEGAQAKIKV
jgi:hypothetical protein